MVAVVEAEKVEVVEKAEVVVKVEVVEKVEVVAVAVVGDEVDDPTTTVAGAAATISTGTAILTVLYNHHPRHNSSRRHAIRNAMM
jgi:serine acetyltransferase